MSKLMHSVSSASLLYSRSLDVSVSRTSRRKEYGRLRQDGTFESAIPSFAVRVPKKIRIPKLGSRRVANNYGNQFQDRLQLNAPGQAVEEPSRTFLGRMRVTYERWMVKAGSASGEFSAIPVAKASRAPAALSSVVSTWIVPPSSKKGTKIADLDPGFKLTAAERKYLEHLKRTAASRRF